MGNGCLFYFSAGESFERFGFGWRLQHVTRGKVFSLRIACLANAFSSFPEIVEGMPKLHVWAKQEPVCAWFSEWHAHAAGVDNANFAYPPIELHVGMPADNH